MTSFSGFVSIIGAGPGDPELLTLKAILRLTKADVVVYDRLISDAIMEVIPEGVAKIFAGKSCKQHHMTQDEINSLLITLAQSGRKVVRLKGGDPFIFGRGGEEAEALAAVNIPFEIVPGISSASGCSAYAGIPLTHRGLSTSVRYFTGHTEQELNWQSLADPDTTLVVYMGLAKLDTIRHKLITHGLPDSTPVAAIQQGTVETQKLVIGTLQDIVEKVAAADLQPPTLIIIGKVVSLAGKLEWFNKEQSSPAQTATPLSQTAARQ